MDDLQPLTPWEPKIGDVVRLRSGGPMMTVTSLKPTTEPPHDIWIDCVWIPPTPNGWGAFCGYTGVVAMFEFIK